MFCQTVFKLFIICIKRYVCQTVFKLVIIYTVYKGMFVRQCFLIDYCLYKRYVCETVFNLIIYGYFGIVYKFVFYWCQKYSLVQLLFIDIWRTVWIGYLFVSFLRLVRKVYYNCSCVLCETSDKCDFWIVENVDLSNVSFSMACQNVNVFCLW